VNGIAGGAIPAEFIDSVDEGIRDADDDASRDSLVGAPLRLEPNPRVSGVALPEPDDDPDDDLDEDWLRV
jgi:hypothetical protein